MKPLRSLLHAVRRGLWHWCNQFSRPGLSRWVRHCRAEAREPILIVGAGGTVGKLLQWGDHVSIDIAPDRNPDILLDVLELSTRFAPASFESAFVIEVLEHVTEPQKAIDELWTVLKPGGRLYLSVPLALETHDLPHDYWRFTCYGLRRLLRNFDEVDITPRGGYLTSSLTPLFRLAFHDAWFDRCLGVLMLVAAAPAYPLLRLVDCCLSSDRYASGYHVVALKRPLGRE